MASQEVERKAIRAKRGLPDLSQEDREKLFAYMSEPRLKPLTLDPEVENFGKSFVGMGKFRDSGRESTPAESVDSLVGAPARRAISEAQDGNFDMTGLKNIVSSIGGDPRNQPTGYDVASKVTDNPYLGAGIATAVDLAQLPMPFAPGIPGVIKKLEGPLYHGSPREFPAAEIKASQGGYVGPGVYAADNAKVAGRYGENVHAYNPKKVNILDLMADDKDATLAAEKLGILDGYRRRADGKYSGPLDQTGRFYALQGALIDKIDPNYQLVGNERAEALINALKDQGFTGFKYKHQDAPAFNIFDAQNLSPVDKSVASGDKAMAQAIIDRIKSPEQAVALKGAEREKYLGALDQIYGDRAKRAKDMGFGTQTWYHGTGGNIDAFDPSLAKTNAGGPTGKYATHFAKDPKLANQYAFEQAPEWYKRSLAEDNRMMEAAIRNEPGASEAFRQYAKNVRPEYEARFQALPKEALQESGNNVIPVRLKTKQMLGSELDGGNVGYDEADLLKNTKDEGKYGGVVFKNAYDNLNHIRFEHPEMMVPSTDIAAVFNPKDIRSVNAAFDPRFKDSDLLLAAQTAPSLTFEQQAILKAIEEKRKKAGGE